MRVASGVGSALVIAVALLATVAVPARALDTTPPTIVGVTVTPPRAAPRDTVTIQAFIGDDTDVATTATNVTGPTGAWQNLTMSRGVSGLYTSPWPDTALVGTYAFVIWAADSAGNGAVARGSFEILNDTLPPTIEALAVNPATQVAGGSVTVSATITDDTFNVEGFPHAVYTLPDGVVVSMSMPGLQWMYVYSDTETWSLPGM